jgi:hypothetical protein
VSTIELLPIDAVVSYHLNPLTCGVAKFNTLLSTQLHAPLISLFGEEFVHAQHPLLSIKPSEFVPADLLRLERASSERGWDRAYSVFLHDYTDTSPENRLIHHARRVFCANELIEQRVSSINARTTTLWAPSMLLDRQKYEPCDIKVFSFGMAHKLQIDHYLKLRELLEDSGKSYALFLSTALHEGTSFEGDFEEAFLKLRNVFGSRIYHLGYLSDSALYNELITSTFFAAFFKGGLRRNNTSVMSAMRSGSVVISNFDAHSPSYLVHGENAFDIEQLRRLPVEPDTLGRVRRAATDVARSLDWADLAACIREQRTPALPMATAAAA